MDWPWLLWGFGTLAVFLALELPALHASPQRTLTARLRVWLGISPRRPIRHLLVPLFIAVVVGFGLWLVAHLLY